MFFFFSGYKIELTAEEQAMSYPGQNPEERQDATHSNQSGPQTSNSNNQNQGQAQGQGQRDRYLFYYLFYYSDTYFYFYKW